MIRRVRQSGFVLLMTVVLLALVAVLLAGLSRRSVARAAEAAAAQDQLQRRWGAATCRSVLLPMAEAALAHASQLERRTVTQVRRRFPLGRQDVVVTIADEQAKANVNLLYARLGKDRATLAVRDLLPPQRADELVTLQPQSDAAQEDDEAPPPFGSWAQVFANAPSSRLFASGAQPAGLTDHLTCWGDGRVNFHRAPVNVIAAVMQPAVSKIQAQRVAEAREETPEADIKSLLVAAGVAEDAVKALEAVFTEKSSCFSISIVTIGQDRTWSELAVRVSSDIDEEAEEDEGDQGDSGEQPPAEQPPQENQHQAYRLVW